MDWRRQFQQERLVDGRHPPEPVFSRAARERMAVHLGLPAEAGAELVRCESCGRWCISTRLCPH